MRQKAHTSKSTYRAILSVQTRRDEPTGLYVSDRFFQPESTPKPRGLLWFAADALLLACLAGGLLLLFVSGFSVPVSLWFFPAVLLLCILITGFFRGQWHPRRRAAAWIGVLLLYLLLLFLCQDAFFQGADQFGSLLADTLTRTYGAQQGPPGALGGERAEVFLLFAAIPAILWLGAALFRKNSLLMASLLLFPLLVLLSLCGAANNTAALFLVLLGFVLCIAYTKPKRQHRMWGGANQQLKQENRIRFQTIQKKAMAMMLGAFLLLSVPGFYLVRPLLSLSLQPAREISVELQSGFLTKVMKLLPELSAGRWKLRTEAVGGGVQDGAVSGSEGYLLDGVEDLRLTLTTKPTEAIFLKGYIGTLYENGSWQNPYGTTFDGAAINWNTEGSPRLYIQNLPFLRAAFALSQGQSENGDVASAMSGFAAEPAQLLVERLNANGSYTYLPYGAYLNDYYEIPSGDGAVAGQGEQEDRFYFFFREQLQEVLSAWNALEGTDNVLDRVEESYRAFCGTNNQAKCTGMDTLLETVQEVTARNHWSGGKNVKEITAWIRQYLAEQYTYQLKPETVPEGKDPLAYFLFESGRGNSVHFASAAVVLYRMFGIPARYVVGYEVPAALFSVQPNGTYTAIAQGDNAQAWAEIYVPGIGWMPEDLTPGVIGTYEQVGPGSEKIEVISGSSGQTEPGPSQTEQPTGGGNETSKVGRFRIKLDSVEQVIRVFLYFLLAVLPAVGILVLGRRVCRALGWDPFHRYSQQTRLIFVFQALYARMRRLGLPEDADSQSEAFRSFCETELSKRCPEAICLLEPAVDKLYRSCFGGEPVRTGDISAMRRILLASYKRAM